MTRPCRTPRSHTRRCPAPHAPGIQADHGLVKTRQPSLMSLDDPQLEGPARSHRVVALLTRVHAQLSLQPRPQHPRRQPRQQTTLTCQRDPPQRNRRNQLPNQHLHIRPRYPADATHTSSTDSTSLRPHRPQDAQSPTLSPRGDEEETLTQPPDKPHDGRRDRRQPHPGPRPARLPATLHRVRGPTPRNCWDTRSDEGGDHPPPTPPR